MAVVVVILAAAAASRTLKYDAVVYDATSGGVTAAVSASRNGLKTALLCASWPACFRGLCSISRSLGVAPFLADPEFSSKRVVSASVGCRQVV